MSDVANPQKSSKRKLLSFNTYIHKTLKDVNSGSNIAKVASTQLDVLIKYFSARLASIAIQYSTSANKSTISVDDVEAATRLLLQGDLCTSAIQDAEKALETFESDESTVKNKAQRSGLSFPPHLSEKFLRQQDGEMGKPSGIKYSISHSAPIYMAAVVECVAKRSLELARDVANDQKRNTINVRHLLLGTHTNDNFKTLLENLNINWLGGGVVPFIHPSLLPSPEKQKKLAAKRKKNRRENGIVINGVKKVLPGTKAMRDIKSLQKNGDLLQAKEHFKRFVKEVIEHYTDEKIYYSNRVFESFQYFIEDKITNIFRESINAMVHSGRETLEDRDIEFVWKLIKPKGFSDVTDAGIDQLLEPGLHRLATRGGVKRISQNCYPIIREIISFYTCVIMKSVVLLLNRQKVKTISLQILRSGASMVGFNIPFDIVRKKKTVATKGDEGADADEGDDEGEGEADEGEEE